MLPQANPSHKYIKVFFYSLRTLLTVFRTLPTFLNCYGWIFGMPLRCLEEGIQWSESISISQNRRRDKTENMAAVITRLIAHRQKRVDRLKTHWGKDCGGLQSILTVWELFDQESNLVESSTGPQKASGRPSWWRSWSKGMAGENMAIIIVSEESSIIS